MQQGSDWETCLRVSRNKPAPTLDVRISACTRILEQGDYESAKNRVLAYINRCSANTHKGDLDRQSPIATEAIRLDPLEGGPQGYDVRVYGGATLAFQLRGHAYIKRGNLDLAIVDYTQVIRLHSKGESSLLFPLDKQLQGDI